MSRPCVMILGRALSDNLQLQLALQDDNRILVLRQTDFIERVLTLCKVDLILLELIKDGDGVSVFERIREQYPELPVIVFNGNGNNEFIAHAFSTGAKDSFRIRGFLDSNSTRTMSHIRVVCNRVRFLLSKKKKRLPDSQRARAKPC